MSLIDQRSVIMVGHTSLKPVYRVVYGFSVHYMAEQSPPAYEESDTRDTTSAPPSQDQFNSGYTPVQYNLAGQDPERFYGE